jgi:hypothetical protein
MSMSDRYSFGERDPYVLNGPEFPASDPMSDDEALDVVNRLASGERVEMAPEHRDLGEFTVDSDIIEDEALKYLADEDKR